MSAAVLDRNRANARHSTGPKTGEGKAASSQNARKHGLTGQLRLQSEQEIQRFQARCDEYARHYPIKSPEAEQLIREMVTAEFRLRQIVAAQRAVIATLQEQYNDEIDETITDPELIRCQLDALVFLRDRENGNVIQRLHRYEQAAHRAWYRAQAELRRLRAEEGEIKTITQEQVISSSTNVQNEPSRREPIDLSKLPWFPPDPLTAKIPPEILAAVRDPKRHK